MNHSTMKARHRGYVLVAGLISLLMLACGGGPITIGGRVVDNRGTPIPRADVETRPETDSVVTNSRGFFVLKQRLNDMGEAIPIPSGTYRLVVKKYGFEDVEFVVNVDGGKTRLKDLIMNPRTPDIGEAAPEVTEGPAATRGGTSTPTTGI
jgi:hypothetical protein